MIGLGVSSAPDGEALLEWLGFAGVADMGRYHRFRLDLDR
jgi:hypothetical protein